MPRNIAPTATSYHPNAFLDDKNGYDGEEMEIKLKVVLGGDIMVLYLNCSNMSVDDFWREIRDACHFTEDQPFTVKWIDEEGDPCTISSQRELDEAFRLYRVNKDSELYIHVFPNVPPLPGLPCQGEDRHVYRRGARRWKKFYRVNGHSFQAKRFNRRATCAICRDRVWGLGRQGFHCINCKLAVHKRCHKLVKFPCGQQPLPPHHSSLPVTQGNLRVPSGLSPLPSHPSLVNGPNAGAYENQGLQVVDHEAHSARDKMGADSASPPSTAGRSGVFQPEFPANAEESAVPTAKSRAVGLDDFNLLKVIGRGSYAKVLQVEHKRTKQVYAMKVIKKTMVTDEEDIDWVQTEKHVFEVASNHPFLVGLHSCFQTSSRLFFVIEFVPGGDLMFHMQRQRRLHEEHSRFYSAEIILALHFLHSCNIIYRDLKLDNVLIDADGHIKLTDYGMCKEGIGPGDTTSTFCGTPNYIAPEILRGEEYSFSVDWWALGVLMYEMLAGRSPFDIVGMQDAPDQQTEDYLFQIILERTIRIPRSLSVKAASILKGFLNKNPKERLGCAQDEKGVFDLERGFQDIKTHAFFKTIQWDLLEQRQVTPPYRPTIKDERDLEHFDKQFTEEPVQFTPDDQSVISTIDQTEFEGFEYVNPFLMTQNDAV